MAKTVDNKLTDKQSLFVKEYTKDFNGTQAAIRAGYSPRTANEQAAQLLAKLSIQAAIREAINKRTEKSEIDAQWVLNKLVDVVDRCMQKKPVMVKTGKDWSQATDENGEGIWTFQVMGANRALELIAKHLGMFTEKISFPDKYNHPLDVDNMSNIEKAGRLIPVLAEALRRQRAEEAGNRGK